MSSGSSIRRLALPASGLFVICAFLHACGGGGSSGGGSAPPPPVVPPPTTFVSTSQFPANSAVNVALVPLILLGFNDVVNPATVINANVFLTQAGNPVNATVSYVACTNQVQMVPVAALLSSTVYTINLAAGLQDDDAEPINPITYTFTTAASTDGVPPTFTVAGFTGVPNAGNETTEIMLDWADGDDPTNPVGTISYRVYMSTTGCFNFANPVFQTGPGITTAVIPGLLSRTDHSFVVRAVDAAGNESSNVNTVDVTTFTSFITNVYPIVSSSCVSCHNPPAGQAWQNTPVITMDYSTPATVFNTWVNIAPSWPAAANAGMLRVDPGDPANSFLYNKISEAIPVAGVQMPFGQPPLNAANQDVIFDWITQGALDN